MVLILSACWWIRMRGLWKLPSLVAQMVKICLQCGRPRFDSWVGKIPWRRAWQPSPVFLLGEYPWTEEPGGLQSTGVSKVGHDWATKYRMVVKNDVLINVSLLTREFEHGCLFINHFFFFCKLCFVFLAPSRGVFILSYWFLKALYILLFECKY